MSHFQHIPYAIEEGEGTRRGREREVEEGRGGERRGLAGRGAGEAARGGERSGECQRRDRVGCEAWKRGARRRRPREAFEEGGVEEAGAAGLAGVELLMS